MTETVVIFLASKLHVVIVVMAILVFLFATKSQRVTLAITLILASPLSYVLGKLASMVYFTERPFVELGIAPLVPHVADNGFPSEHALYAMTIAMIVFTMNKRWGIALAILALLVGLGRILANIHSVTDIVGSIFVATVTGYIVTQILTLKWAQIRIKLLQDLVYNINS